MPTFLRRGPYRIFCYSSDRNEPPHVHIERDDRVAKFWIDPVQSSRGGGFSRAELRYIERILKLEREALLEAWHDYFSH